MDNKFITTKDDKIEDTISGVKIPKEWWSRPYEYAFALKHLKKTDIIIDAGCGLEHPFKWGAAKICKKVYAIDNDARILDLDNSQYESHISVNMLKDIDRSGNIELIHSEIYNNCAKEKVDKIFCISVLEHMSPELIDLTIKNFSEMLKPGGQLILTMDYPAMQPNLIVDKVKAHFDIGKTDYNEHDPNNLRMDLYGFMVFTLIGKKVK